MKIALVEDDERTRSRIVELLVNSLARVQIQEFSGLASAKLFALDHAQDYWLVDLGLPDGSGVELIRAVRALYADTHILVISVFPQPSIRPPVKQLSLKLRRQPVQPSAMEACLSCRLKC